MALLVSLASLIVCQAPPPFADEVEWRCIGPFRGGRCTAVAGVVQDPMTYYFGSCGGGVWKTGDAGTTWRNVSDGFFGTGSVGALAVAPSDPNVVYAGMGEAQIRGVTTSHGDGVYRSTDAGHSWTHLGLEQTRTISTVVVHPADPDTVWIAAQGDAWRDSKARGIYRSRDGGQSWKQVLFLAADVGASSLCVDPGNPRVLYAGMWQHRRTPWRIGSGGEHGGVFKSSDGGDSWQKLTAGLPALAGKIGVAVSPAEPSRVYAIVEADEGGLFRSDDSGTSFRRVNSERILRARAWYYTKVIAHPTNANTVFVMNAPFMRSIDGGVTFERVATPHGDNHALWIHPGDPRWMINGNDGGANVSTNAGRTWSTQNNQPTAQFYRVIADRRFPYRVYGGQQDNTTVAIQSASRAGGIAREHWHSVGGGESAFVAFNPDDPRLIYAGVYQGLITEYDAVTRATRDIMAKPVLGLGSVPRDLPYRFNWNAPIVAAPDDSGTIYHAANVLLRTRDRGRSWTEVSPDLTRNDVSKQGPGGGPITSEGAGGEIYGTIAYVACSPHEPGTVWAGSDDGLVHVTRNAGGDWRDVTPPGVGEALINAIEVSPHDPGAAYLAVTKYKFGDLTPQVFVTSDYGSTWNRRVDGLPGDSFVRVVREDPRRAGLLYCGTETGVYASFDAGGRWQKLQGNLPIVPITDLFIRDDDLIAATQGRAFWILDDLSPLQQFDSSVAAEPLHLFAPRAAVRFASGGRGSGGGQNRPAGATVFYRVGAKLDDPLELAILDSDGAVLRTLEAGEAAAPDPNRRGPAPVTLKSAPGLHRVVWDLRRDSVHEVEGLFVYGNRQGPRVAPGRYQLRLTAGDRVRTAELAVVDDPRKGELDYRAQQRLAVELWQWADQVQRAIERVRSIRSQVRALRERHSDRAAVATAADALTAKLYAWERRATQPDQETFQDVINFPNQLNARILDLLGKIDAAGPPVTAGAKALAAELGERWGELESELDGLLDRDVAEFNRLFADGVIR